MPLFSNFCNNLGCQCVNPGPEGPQGPPGLTRYGVYSAAVRLAPVVEDGEHVPAGEGPTFEQQVNIALPVGETRRIVHVEPNLRHADGNSMQQNVSIDGARISNMSVGNSDFRDWNVWVQVPSSPVFLSVNVYVADMDIDGSNSGSLSMTVEAP